MSSIPRGAQDGVQASRMFPSLKNLAHCRFRFLPNMMKIVKITAA
jgi:hypothetical protein